MVPAFQDIQEMETDARGDALDHRHSYVPCDAINILRHSVDLQPAMGRAYSCERHALTLALKRVCSNSFCVAQR
jgi:hypothetical protein